MARDGAPAGADDVDDGAHLLLVASTGGHLAQLVGLRSWWSGYDRTWVTFDKSDARSALSGERVIHAHHPTTRDVGNAFRNLALAARVLPAVAPHVLVTTGAGVAAPFALVARARGVPVIYLEVVDRVDTATVTGRLCRPLADAFCVQWPQQRGTYPGADLVGPLL